MIYVYYSATSGVTDCFYDTWSTMPIDCGNSRYMHPDEDCLRENLAHENHLKSTRRIIREGIFKKIKPTKNFSMFRKLDVRKMIDCNLWR